MFKPNFHDKDARYLEQLFCSATLRICITWKSNRVGRYIFGSQLAIALAE
jgi:hypothetical protein